MYIANRRESSKFKGCSPFQLNPVLTGLKPAIAWLPSTYRYPIKQFNSNHLNITSTYPYGKQNNQGFCRIGNHRKSASGRTGTGRDSDKRGQWIWGVQLQGLFNRYALFGRYVNTWQDLEKAEPILREFLKQTKCNIHRPYPVSVRHRASLQTYY